MVIDADEQAHFPPLVDPATFIPNYEKKKEDIMDRVTGSLRPISRAGDAPSVELLIDLVYQVSSMLNNKPLHTEDEYRRTINDNLEAFRLWSVRSLKDRELVLKLGEGSSLISHASFLNYLIC